MKKTKDQYTEAGGYLFGLAIFWLIVLFVIELVNYGFFESTLFTVIAIVLTAICYFVQAALYLIKFINK